VIADHERCSSALVAAAAAPAVGRASFGETLATSHSGASSRRRIMKRALAAVVLVCAGVACGSSGKTAVAPRSGTAPAPAGPQEGGTEASAGYGALCTPKHGDAPARADGEDDDEAFVRHTRGMFGPLTIQTLYDGGTCSVADSNLIAAEKEILAQPTPKATSRRSTWDGVTPPKYWSIVTGQVHPTPQELSLLRTNGFVALGRVPVGSYAKAYHDIYQLQLPVFVTVDSVLSALFASHDTILASIEQDRLEPLLDEVLAAMHCALFHAKALYGPEVAADADVYLTVARALLAGKAVSMLGNDEEASALVDRAERSEGLERVSLFGRERMIDSSQYAPRGHYASSERSLAGYFRASMWLSRLELNLVSRSSWSSHPDAAPDPRETPREELSALALSDLTERAGVMKDLETLENAWAMLAGKREDVSLSDLARLRKKANIASLLDPDAPARLRAAIGSDFKRTVRMHFMPQNAPELPAIATMLGARVVADAAATKPLVHDDLPGRHLARAADMAYAIGQDHAKKYLADDRRRFPQLDAALDRARGIVRDRSQADDLHAAWLRALRALGEPARGAIPSFMDRPAYADFRLNTAIVGFGQLRHDHVLLAGQGFDSYGCEIPDGYVEPAPEVFDALAAYAVRGEAMAASLDPKDASGARRYFSRFGQVMRVFARIARTEIAGAPLSPAERRWLAMVAEFKKGGSDGQPKYTGYYFDLYFDRRGDSRKAGDFVADLFTSSNLLQVVYVGGAPPVLGLFVVDAGGAPRVMVGPVAHGYEHVGPLARRLTDEDARALAKVDDPWTKSYFARTPTSAGVKYEWAWNDVGRFVKVEGPAPLGSVLVELLDHHGVPFARRWVTAKGAIAEVPFEDEQSDRTEGVHVRALGQDVSSSFGGVLGYAGEP
jgi:hypothetical protein